MSIPKDVVRSLLSEGLAHAPELLAGLGALFKAAGFDLGPMTPDIRADFKRVDNKIAAELDELERRDRAKARSTQVGALGVHVHENGSEDDVRGYRRPVPDPDPTPRPSSR